MTRGTPSEFARLLRRGGLLIVVLVIAAIGGALALNQGSSSSLQLLPPPPPAASSRPADHRTAPPRVIGKGDDVIGIVNPDLSHKGPLAGGPPGTGSLAGPPAQVLRRFATLWANRSTLPDLRARRELIGLSGGAWASQVIEQIGVSLPSFPEAGAQGSVVAISFEPSTAGTKSAVVLTKEHLTGPAGHSSPYRYMVYLARLDWIGNDGYVVTEWEQQT